MRGPLPRQRHGRRYPRSASSADLREEGQAAGVAGLEVRDRQADQPDTRAEWIDRTDEIQACPPQLLWFDATG